MSEMEVCYDLEPQKTGSFSLPGIGKLVISKRKARIGEDADCQGG